MKTRIFASLLLLMLVLTGCSQKTEDNTPRLVYEEKQFTAVITTDFGKDTPARKMPLLPETVLGRYRDYIADGRERREHYLTDSRSYHYYEDKTLVFIVGQEGRDGQKMIYSVDRDAWSVAEISGYAVCYITGSPGVNPNYRGFSSHAYFLWDNCLVTVNGRMEEGELLAIVEDIILSKEGLE